MVKNEHGGSQELPEKGNLFFSFRNIFSKKSSEDIFRNDNYDCNWRDRFKVFCLFILCAEEKWDKVISKCNEEAFWKIKCEKKLK